MSGRCFFRELLDGVNVEGNQVRGRGFFRELLDGVNVEGNQVRGREVNEMRDEDGVSIELVREVIASLKKGKACGVDQVESEAWLWATDEYIMVLAACGVDQVESEAWLWATDEYIMVLAGFLDETWRGARE
ncbi:hypothetical protein QE152_g333 [Popillia japonica]|uniref:Uncharacterized protein n=1 Tax=Popillia japonica TaxID=7064 RepID=A0AAW1NLY1_POPJA